MSDLEYLQVIEETFGFKLKKVDTDKRDVKQFYIINPFELSLYDREKQSSPYKGARNYSVNESGNITGFSLDYSPCFLLPKNFFMEFKNLIFLSMRSICLNDVSFLKEMGGLTFLDLSDNRNIKDFSFLKEMEGLTSLSLSSNKNIKDISFLKEMEGLISLNLSCNNISDVSFLKEMEGLTSLDLSYNNLRDVSFLKDMEGLTSLDLSYNKLSDVSFLKEMGGLTSLALSYNDLSDVSFLKEFKCLTSLDLSNSKLKYMPFPQELKRLASLSLRNNDLNDVSFLQEIEGLTSLDLSYNNLSDVSFLKEMKGLTSLDLSYNYLSDVSFLQEMEELTSLCLSYNNISDVTFLKEIKGLSSLSLRNNDISDVSFLKEMEDLTSLDLSYNYLSDVSFLQKMQGLTSLSLMNNYLSNVSFLKELKGLISLSLRNNDLSDVSFLKEMKSYNTVDLADNNIKNFESWLVENRLDIKIEDKREKKCINLYGNPLESPPLQVVKQGNDAIRKYFKDIEKEGTDYIYEAKLLILGEPGAGKTTFARKIKDKTARMPEEEETTRGIDVKKWKFIYNIYNQGEMEITVNIWDFGGQSIYKATHRFFLTHRSFYTILADARKENTDFYYWLHTVELFGEESPVLIVINEKEDRKRDLPYQKLQIRFSHLKDKKEVNFKNTDERFDNLMDKLKYEISHLKHIGDPIPANWKKVREEIAELENEKVISLKTYRELCTKHQLTVHKDQDIVCEFFNDLGIFLHFKNDDVLHRLIFVDKEWVLDAAYMILDDKSLAKKQGRFERSDIEMIFSHEYSGYVPEIIALMKKFYLVYEKDGFIIAPQMLPYDAPKYHWDNKENIQFHFEYEIFMPAGILWQFIVEMKEEIKDDLVWRFGILLDFNDTEAEVIEINEKNLIQIKVKGKRKEDIRAVIIRKIDEINRQFKKLKTKKLVPCVCERCRDSKEPYLFDYKTLINAKNAQLKIQELQCQSSFKVVKVDNLFSGIEFLEKESVGYEYYSETNPLNIAIVTPKEKKPFFKKTWFIIVASILTGIGSLITWILKNLSDLPKIKAGFKSFLDLF